MNYLTYTYLLESSKVFTYSNKAHFLIVLLSVCSHLIFPLLYGIVLLSGGYSKQRNNHYQFVLLKIMTFYYIPGYRDDIHPLLNCLMLDKSQMLFI